MRHRRIIALFIGLALALPGFALSIEELDVNTSMLLIGHGPAGREPGDANPAIAYPSVSRFPCVSRAHSSWMPANSWRLQLR